jgi:hypothetical protein
MWKGCVHAHQHNVDQGFVQRRGEVAEAVDALAVAQRLRQGAAQRERCAAGQRPNSGQ